ncbi:MAG: ABC transporter substrate-binding protein [Arcobacteraceae bacterium]|nr:ABC transporter substrate-binding protein [Arcobacteraceae bacterium]
MIKKVLLLTILLINSAFSNDNTIKRVSLQLQWKHAFQFAGYYIAKEKGYYKNVGIDLEIKEYQYGLNIALAVEKGDSTYGVGRPSIIIDKAKGRDIILLAAIYQSSPLVILATKKSGIKSIKDFKDKTIMTVSDSSNDAAINAMLKSQNLSLLDMNVIKHSFNVKDLTNGKADLLTAYISNQPFELKESGYEPVIFDPNDYGFNFYSDILFTSNYELKNNPKRVSDFKNASLEGWGYAFDNIEETIELILKKYNTQNISKEALIYEAKELRKLAYYKTNTIGKIEHDKIIKILGIYNLMGTTKEITNLKDFIYEDKNRGKPDNFNLTSKQIQYLKEKQQITMCIDPDWMPFEKFDKHNNHIGLSRDYFNIFEKQLNIPIRVIKTKSWSESLEFARSKKCDILSLAMETPMRKQYMNFTTPYLSVPLVLATKNYVPFIDDFKQLKNKKIGIVQGYAYIEILKNKYPNLNIINVKNTNDGLQKIADGKLFGFIGSIADIGYNFQKNFIGELKIAGKFDERWELGVAVRSDDLILLDIFQKVIQNISYDTKQSIFNKYIAIKYEKGIDYTLVWQTSIGFLLALFIMIFFLIRQNKLKKEIGNLNKNLEVRIKEEVEKNRIKDKTIFRQSKLASMGEMIGNIAHQWRQPLNRISLSLAVIEDVVKEPVLDKQMIENKINNAQKNLTYMSDTIEDFANFFRPDKQMVKFNILKVINKAIGLLESRLENVDLTILAKKDIELKTYESELLQVILIILNNALDNFEIKKIENRKIEILLEKYDDGLKIDIIDNGGGIEEENNDKIFDPYFTTKFKNEGTGLGLYMAKLVIEDSMSGELQVISNKDGATFTIKLNEVN